MSESIATLVKRRADTMPEADAIVFPDRTFSYRNIWQLAEAFALRFTQNGVTSRSTIHVDSDDLSVVLPAILAAALIGAKFLQNVGSTGQKGIPDVTHAFVTPSSAATSTAFVIDGTWSPNIVRAELGSWTTGSNVETDQPWLIVYTSGTTGTPKFVGLSQRMVILRSHAVAHEFKEAETRFVSLYPYDSRPFIARAMAALVQGATIVDQPNPDAWKEAGVNRVCAPSAAARHILGSRTLPQKIETLEIAGSAMASAEIQHLLKSFVIVDDTYGATETNKSYSNLWTSKKDGTPLLKGCAYDSEVQIITTDGELCADYEIGTVRVRNRYMAKDYINDPDATSTAFNAGWFYPGDQAHWGANSALILAQRGGDVINRDGAKLSLTVIDHVMQLDEGVTDAVCFHNPKESSNGELVAFLILAEGGNPVQATARVQKNCVDRLGQSVTPKTFWPVKVIPRLKDGSPDRDACAASVLAAAERRKKSTPS